MEPSPPVMCKKLCNMVRVILFMVRNGVSKSKLMLDLHLLMKRGKILKKAFNDLVIRHHTALSCRSDDVHTSFVSPKEYEFSCSNSPANLPYVPFHVGKRKAHYPYTQYKHHAHNYRRSHAPPTHEDVVAVLAGLGGGGGGDDVVEESPLVGPMVCSVRITDSPFPLEDADKDCHVDKAAEEFIEKFYKQLRLQKRMAAREAPYHYG